MKEIAGKLEDMDFKVSVAQYKAYLVECGLVDEGYEHFDGESLRLWAVFAELQDIFADTEFLQQDVFLYVALEKLRNVFVAYKGLLGGHPAVLEQARSAIANILDDYS